MLGKIRGEIERELNGFAAAIDRRYGLNKISPLLSKNIKNFILTKGKRVRPTLFVLSYLGFAKGIAKNLYAGALSLEILHDFLLIHDDIIDKSDLRRGEPSMHNRLNRYLKGYRDAKFSGQDLAIVVGDIMYAMAIDTFLSIKEEFSRKEKALKKFIQAAICTGAGEFTELLYCLKDIERLDRQNIYKIYDLKTAYYTFAYPLAIGATLAGAKDNEIETLFEYGRCLGRAFQIQDDTLGMLAEKSKTGKSILTDLQETKKTVLIWYAYNNSGRKNKLIIKSILAKRKVRRQDLLKMRNILKTSGAFDYCRNEILDFSRQAENLLINSKLKPKYKDILKAYAKEILSQ